MIYADYDFYCNEYLGKSVPEEDFDRLALRGSQYIDYITQGRAKRHPCLEDVKMACCALAEQCQVIDGAMSLAHMSMDAVTDDSGMELSSQTVGPWSKTYRSGGETAQAASGAAESAQSALYGIAARYLAGTGLLYRGGRRCR